MKTLRPYPEEEVSELIVYIKDTPINRQKLRDRFGPPALEIYQPSYLAFDIVKNIWTTTFTFSWLYRNPPILIGIEEIL